MELTQEIVRELLDYDPETGELRWKERGIQWFENAKYPEAQRKRWNTRYAGKEAFTNLNLGYKVGDLLSNRIKAHRVIWLWMTGEWPFYIDHIDRNRANNKWSNLRNTSAQMNSRNQKKRSTNSSGVNGVYWRKDISKWVASIPNGGKNKHLGVFDNIKDAALARSQAEIELGYSPDHGRF
jgi:hypothetical protein